jgi:hypothetical protein
MLLPLPQRRQKRIQPPIAYPLATNGLLLCTRRTGRRICRRLRSEIIPPEHQDRHRQNPKRAEQFQRASFFAHQGTETRRDEHIFFSQRCRGAARKIHALNISQHGAWKNKTPRHCGAARIKIQLLTPINLLPERSSQVFRLMQWNLQECILKIKRRIYMMGKRQ